MAPFARDWLGLREPYDHAARSGSLAAKFAAAVGPAPRVIDLGCGTGSNLRYLSPRLGPHQVWLCLDHDPALLDEAAQLIARWADARGLAHERPGRTLHLRGRGAAVDVALLERDLANLRRAFGTSGTHGITAAAFLDLASAAWLDALAHKIAAARLPVLFALTYDGRLEWWPVDEADARVRDLFHRHQRTDKGLGAALGPAATGHLAGCLERQGFRTRSSPTDWRLDAADRGLMRLFLEGLVAAVRELADDASVTRWLELRRAQLRAGELRVRVGHLDLLALPS